MSRESRSSSIRRDAEKCIGCRACEIACSLHSNGAYDFEKSNIVGIRAEDQVVFSVCRQCEKPECVLVCPVNAIARNEKGTVLIDEEICVHCGICSTVCSYGGIRFLTSRTSKCDLCNGRPSCVALCPKGALEYEGQTSLTAQWASGEDLVSPGLSSCLGCTVELGLRFAMRTLGSNSILAIPPGCMGGVGVVGYGITTGMKIPVFFPLLDNIASMLTGIKVEYARKGVEVNVVAFAGDGGTADVGFQCLSAAAERGENIIYICYDNEGYMNTGFQRSGTTPYGAWTSTTPVGKRGTGKKQVNKNLPLIMAAHEIPYVATACMSYPHDFERKLRKAMAVKDGLVYIHLFTPCPTGWRFPTDKGIEVGRLAVETDFFPLWEMERGVYRSTVEVKEPRPIEEYLRKMGKYEHLTKRQTEEIGRIIERRRNVLNSMIGKQTG